jgi:hypothetical protein
MPHMTTSSTHSIHMDKRQQSRSSCAHWMQSDSQCKSRLTTSLLRRRDVEADEDGVRLDITHGITPRVIRNGHPSGFMVAVAVVEAEVNLELNGRGRPVQELRKTELRCSIVSCKFIYGVSDLKQSEWMDGRCEGAQQGEKAKGHERVCSSTYKRWLSSRSIS